MTDFIVETGTGRTDATSFVSLAYFQEYSKERGRCLADFVNLKQRAALVRATQYLSESHKWAGYRVNSRNDSQGYQALAWPRYDVLDRAGNYVPSDSIPREIKQATCELGFYELKTPHGLQPVYTAHSRQKTIKAGSVSITYDVNRRDAWGARPVLLLVMDLIGEFISGSAGSRLSGRAARI